MCSEKEETNYLMLQSTQSWELKNMFSSTAIHEIKFKKVLTER